MAILKPIVVNENVVVSTTKMDTESLMKFFHGKSEALKKEVEEVTGKQQVINLSHYRKEDIKFTPDFFKQRRLENGIIRSKFFEEQKEDLALFKQLLNKGKKPCE
jgi:hypothetical protein